MNKKGSGAMVAFTVFCLAGVIALFAQADLSIGHGENGRQESMNPSSGAPELIQRRIAEDRRQMLGKDGKSGKSRLKCCGRSEND
tara:strand:+ start:375 stop:629 length:255 start_codon:yes stop_codon:yes gene_type:complete